MLSWSPFVCARFQPQENYQVKKIAHLVAFYNRSLLKKVQKSTYHFLLFWLLWGIVFTPSKGEKISGINGVMSRSDSSSWRDNTLYYRKSAITVQDRVTIVSLLKQTKCYCQMLIIKVSYHDDKLFYKMHYWLFYNLIALKFVFPNKQNFISLSFCCSFAHYPITSLSLRLVLTPFFIVSSWTSGVEFEETRKQILTKSSLMF